MTEFDPVRAREFAVEVVRRLRGAGFEALWAGGCVRDLLLGIAPKDYDVATAAMPEQIREVFGRRRTLAIGQAFGVITVLGPRGAGQIEVATFRSDATYSDGRHPDSVSFSTAEFDAQRRDFTINGLFYDPLAERVIDYVGGQADLQRRLVRAIGDPFARIAEDKLRMLRAVRIAATFAFELDADTQAAIQRQAHELIIVSAERVAAELRRMLTQPHRARALTLLRETDLLAMVLPESTGWFRPSDWHEGDTRWPHTLAMLDRLPKTAAFAVAFAVLLRAGGEMPGHEFTGGDFHDVRPPAAETINHICQRLRLAHAESAAVDFFLRHEAAIRHARRAPWPKLQRILIDPHAANLLQFCRAVATEYDAAQAELDFCQEKLSLPREQLDPPPLITGHDLKAAGMKPGPRYAAILTAVRDEQLDGWVTTRDDALAMAMRLNETLASTPT